MFRAGIEPLASSGKLGALLAQFPPSFQNNLSCQQILTAVMRTFGQYRLALELRHRSWSDGKNTARILSENNASWVLIDEPKFQSSLAGEISLTADTAYFRFHSRNCQTWWGGGETRYKLLYYGEEMGNSGTALRRHSNRPGCYLPSPITTGRATPRGTRWI